MFGRGQDAYVHHFVVKQNVNLDQTYYDDIDVDVLTVTMTPRSSFRILYDSNNEVAPTELGAFTAKPRTARSGRTG